MQRKNLKTQLIGLMAAVVLALPVGAVAVDTLTPGGSTVQANPTPQWDCPPDC